ncbi:MAG: hypothetical protein EPN30_00740 [Actinomycetota bacterium]|nr:MAG: hypothetical protein EPN30_00740 [Actinomycetota bacterium]
MNPLERLRYIARIEGEDPISLALEATYVIAELAGDKSVLISALRRLLDRHPDFGVIWTLASRIAGSIFPEEEAWNLVGELSALPRNTDAAEFPALRIERNGTMTFRSGFRDQPMRLVDADQGIDILGMDPTVSLVVDSDLVSSRFAVVHAQALPLIRGNIDLTENTALTISAGDYSLVPISIRESLESRLSRAGAKGELLRLIDFDGIKIKNVVYHGSSFSPEIIDRIARWRVPQEILRSAGPMLG